MTRSEKAFERRVELAAKAFCKKIISDAMPYLMERHLQQDVIERWRLYTDAARAALLDSGDGPDRWPAPWEATGRMSHVFWWYKLPAQVWAAMRDAELARKI